MYGHFVVFFTTIMCLQSSWSADPQSLERKHNIFCQPLPQVVPVNGDELPYFVEIHQCQGSVKGFHPQNRNCTFETFNNVTVELTNQKVVILKNHTSCKSQCAKSCSSKWSVRDENTCACKCNYLTPPESCPENHVWDSESCECKCEEKTPTSLMEFDRKQCKLVCKKSLPKCREGWQLNAQCKCRPGFSAVSGEEESDNGIQGKVLAALMIGEFVFLYLIFDSYLYRKDDGLIRYVLRQCKRTTGQSDNTRGQNEPLQSVAVNKNEPSHNVNGST